METGIDLIKCLWDESLETLARLLEHKIPERVVMAKGNRRRDDVACSSLSIDRANQH